MEKYYIKFNGTEITYIYKFKEFEDLYTTECESNLLLEADKCEIDTINEQEKTCTIKRKEVITEEII